MLTLPDYWMTGFQLCKNKNEIEGTLFLGLSKAIGLVDHKTLVKTLALYGLRDSVIAWFISYLRSRT